MSRMHGKILCLAVFLFLHVTMAFSQADNGQISGAVTDPQGLPVTQATVQIINQDTLTKREAKTDEMGRYSFSLLPGGRYQVVVEVVFEKGLAKLFTSLKLLDRSVTASAFTETATFGSAALKPPPPELALKSPWIYAGFSVANAKPHGTRPGHGPRAVKRLPSTILMARRKKGFGFSRASLAWIM